MSLNALIEYVIGSILVNPLNPSDIVSTGKVPPDAASWSTNIINAINLPISPKCLIKNWIILINAIPTNIHSPKYIGKLETSNLSIYISNNPVPIPSIAPIAIYARFWSILFFLVSLSNIPNLCFWS